jgi:hypothetical protein
MYSVVHPVLDHVSSNVILISILFSTWPCLLAFLMPETSRLHLIIFPVRSSAMLLESFWLHRIQMVDGMRASISPMI